MTPAEPADGATPRVPLRATYRVQLTPSFTLHDLVGVVPYLARLGVSHVYTSPLLQSAPGSEHGYDVVDHSTVDEELGGRAGFDALCAALRQHGLGLVVDVVPNHMAVGDPRNRWWWDVLTHGPESRYAQHFDIDWDPDVPSLGDRVLVPVLAERYGQELAAGSITVEREGDGFVVRYGSQTFPVRPSTFREARRALGGAPADIHELLEHQHYRLAQWRTASEELDYRRFFDVTSLAGLRVEDPEVFAEVHALALDWVAAGDVHGLRIDHPDGLRNPRAYFERLAAAAPGAWVVAEKILEHGEALRPGWAVAGTTGYEVAALLTGILVDTDAEAAVTAGYVAFVGSDRPYADVATDAKREVLHAAFGTELDRLAAAVVALARRVLELRDLPRSVLRTAIAELLVAFPVYRSYIEAPEYRPVPADLDLLGEAHRRALDAGLAEPDALAAVVAVLTGDVTGPGAANVTARFQQTSGPVMAKGIEDTAFYRYSRSLALCEVGSDPARFGVGVEEFHRELAARSEQWPFAMTSTSTHDTKRSEDVRARLAVLTELPDEWFATVTRWRASARGRGLGDGIDPDFEHFVFQTIVGAWPIGTDRLAPYLEKAMREAKRFTTWTAPDEAAERVVHELAAAFVTDPELVADVERFAAGVEPAGRVNALSQKLLALTVPGVPDLYQGSELWTDSLVDPDNRRPVDFARRAALLDELDAPVRPDDEAGVDRSPFEPIGRAKLLLVRAALAVRAELPQVFENGDHRPLEPQGAAVDHVVAFVRGGRVAVVVPRLPWTLAAAGGWRGTTLTLPPGRWTDRITGAHHEVGSEPGPDGQEWVGAPVALDRLLGRFPVALLVREDRR